MHNTLQAALQEFTILVTATNPDADFMAALSSTTGDFSLVLQVSPNDVIKATGLIAIPSGIVTAIDIGRALEAAMTLPCQEDVIMLASTNYCFAVDGLMETEFMPIGMPAKRLAVTVSLVRIPEGLLKRWREWATVLERKIVSWRIEELKAL